MLTLLIPVLSHISFGVCRPADPGQLNLLSGEWWENPSWGCEIFDMIRSGRVTENDISVLSSYLSSYIAATPGVRSAEDAQTAVSGRRFTYSCRVLTENGYGQVSWSAEF